MKKSQELLPAQIGAAIKAFRAESCPSCDREKLMQADPFCEPCLERLPQGFRDGFLDRSRFIELFHPAMDHLRGT